MRDIGKQRMLVSAELVAIDMRLLNGNVERKQKIRWIEVLLKCIIRRETLVTQKFPFGLNEELKLIVK